jgi:hypothetical protein
VVSPTIGWTAANSRIFSASRPSARAFALMSSFLARRSALVRRDAPGVDLHDDYSGFGRRTSGSGPSRACSAR